jgi:hypothetical protein
LQALFPRDQIREDALGRRGDLDCVLDSGQLVPRLAVVLLLGRAKSKPGKDAGTPRIELKYGGD